MTFAEWFSSTPRGHNPTLKEAFAAGAASRDAEIAGLRLTMNHTGKLIDTKDAEITELVEALERMRVAGGSQEFHIAWELAKDVLAKVRKP